MDAGRPLKWTEGKRILSAKASLWRTGEFIFSVGIRIKGKCPIFLDDAGVDTLK